MKRLAILGLFGAVAIILGYVEILIPIPLGIPGVKLGLANLGILLLLYLYSWKEAAIVSLIRILMIGFMFGNVFSIFYSLAGAIVSLFFMNLLKKSGRLSIVGISVVGGITHNLGQLLMVFILMESYGYLYYLPVLLISGVVTGFLVGTITGQVEKRIGAYIRKC